MRLPPKLVNVGKVVEAIRAAAAEIVVRFFFTQRLFIERVPFSGLKGA